MVQITLLGNLTKDAEVRNTQGEYKAISFSLAVNEKRKDKEDASAFFNCTYWSKSEKIAQYLTKGKKVLANIDWVETTEKDGKYYTNYRVRNVNPFLDSKSSNDAGKDTYKAMGVEKNVTKMLDKTFKEEIIEDVFEDDQDLPF